MNVLKTKILVKHLRPSKFGQTVEWILNVIMMLGTKFISLVHSLTKSGKTKASDTECPPKKLIATQLRIDVHKKTAFLGAL